MNKVEFNPADKSFNISIDTSIKPLDGILNQILDLIGDHNIILVESDIISSQDYILLSGSNDVYELSIDDIFKLKNGETITLHYVNDILSFMDLEDEDHINFLNWAGTPYIK